MQRGRRGQPSDAWGALSNDEGRTRQELPDGSEGKEARGSSPDARLQATATENDRGRRALVVDDDDETREYLRDLLALCGFEVEAAADAQGARALVKRRVPDIMLIDLMMPRENGASLLRGLRADHVEAPALIVTARTGEMPESCGRELGAFVVRKPFRAADLLDAVTRACARTPF